MIGEIICVGNELLIGDTLNTNTQYLSQQMTALGVSVTYQEVVGDDEALLLKALATARNRADIIVLSGGLGPTYDDLTKETVAKSLKQEMVLDQDALEDLKTFFESRGRVMAETNLKQVYRPEGGICLPNPEGTAPGIYVVSEDVHYFLLPGPPRELKPMFQAQVAPRIRTISPYVIGSRIYRLIGVGESDLAQEIGHIMDVSTNPRIAPYATLGSVHIRLTATGKDSKDANRLLDSGHELIWPYLEKYCYTYEDKGLAEIVVEMLKNKKLKVATAESCTGGLLAGRITDVSGSSAVFDTGIVAYANHVKHGLLDVPESLIEALGAVSEPVAAAMAEGVAKLSQAQFGIGISGIAGPTGGTAEKPVGTVCIAWYYKNHDQEIRKSETYRFNGNREKVRDYSAWYALVGLYHLLKDAVD